MDEVAVQLGFLAVLGLVAGLVVLNRGIGVVEVIDEIAAFDSLAAHGDQLVRRPAVAAHHDLLDAELARLVGGEGDFLEEVGHEDDVGIRGLDLGELGPEIDVAGVERLVGHDGAALLLEVSLEELAQALRIVVGHVVEDGGFLGAELVEGVAGGDGALVRIDEADAEVIGLDLAVEHGDFGIGGDRGDIGNLGLLENGRDGDRVAGGVRPEDAHDLVLAGQALRDVDGFLRVALVIVADRFELVLLVADLDSAGGVVLIKKHLYGVELVFAPNGLVARERAEPADLDRIALSSAGAADEGEGDNEHRSENRLLHKSSL